MTPDNVTKTTTSRLVLSVPDISCDHCKTAIEGAVGAIDGVASVDVAIGDKTVDIAIVDPADRSAVVAAIEGQGYEVA